MPRVSLANRSADLQTVSLPTLIPFLAIALVLLLSLALAITVYVRAEKAYSRIEGHNRKHLAERYPAKTLKKGAKEGTVGETEDSVGSVGTKEEVGSTAGLTSVSRNVVRSKAKGMGTAAKNG